LLWGEAVLPRGEAVRDRPDPEQAAVERDDAAKPVECDALERAIADLMRLAVQLEQELR